MLVCGGRRYSNQEKLFRVLDTIYEGFKDDLGLVLINGDAEGADKLSSMWANMSFAKHEKLELLLFPAKWEIYGMKAGRVRNEEMAKEAKPEIAVVFPGGEGTKHMLSMLRLYKCPTVILIQE